MPNYRRNHIQGGTYFFTVNLQNRRSGQLTAEIDALREAVRHTQSTLPFQIDAAVILPDHLLCLWTLPPGDSDFPTRWRTIKTYFSRHVAQRNNQSESQGCKRQTGIWQRGYWEHTIQNARDYAAHMDYIHFNPVKHGLALHPANWPFSTFKRCVAQGLYPPDWAIADVQLPATGERPEMDPESS